MFDAYRDLGSRAMAPGIAVVGISHARASTAVRERLHLSPESAAALARSLAGGVHEAVVLTTCNRTELYVAGADLSDTEQRAKAALADLDGRCDEALRLYVHSNAIAAKHLFRVIAGLDSIVVGDTHVASQVRQAHCTARNAGATGPLLDRLFEAAAAASKRVRSETAISSGQNSIPGVAITAASRMAGPLSKRRLLVIGAGTIAQLVALHAARRGCQDIVVANRDVARAGGLACRVGGRVASLGDLNQEVAEADVIISATSAPGFVLTARHIADGVVGRRHRPLVIFDLALPRDVDPRLHDPPRVQLIGLDDLARVVVMSGSRRIASVEHAEAIAEEEAQRYDKWRCSRGAVPAIVALRSDADQARRSVLTRHRVALGRLAPKERRLVETITAELVGKLLHQPTIELRRVASEGNG